MFAYKKKEQNGHIGPMIFRDRGKRTEFTELTL
jgi:hypothetical protein